MLSSYLYDMLVSFRKPSGDCGMATCTARDNFDEQKKCSFFICLTHFDRCRDMYDQEFCRSLEARDYSEGRPLTEKDVPNPPWRIANPGFWGEELPESGRRIVVSKGRNMGKSVEDHDFYKRLANVEEKAEVDDEMSADYHIGFFDSEGSLSELRKWPNHCRIGFNIDESASMINEDELQEFKDEMKKLGEELRREKIKELHTNHDEELDSLRLLPFINKDDGSLDKDRLHKFIEHLLGRVKNYGGWLPNHRIEVVSTEYLHEIFKKKFAAYSEPFKLYLDMTHPNLYTIYTDSGKLISIVDLIRDGIYPDMLDFRMVGGDNCLEEYGFRSLYTHLENMVLHGR